MDSNRAAAKAAPRKILLRITANLTNAFAAKSAPQRVATDTNVAFLFPPGERDSGLADYSSTPAFVNLGRYDNLARALLRRPRAKLNRQS